MTSSAACPVCGGEEFSPTLKVLDRCEKCHFVMYRGLNGLNVTSLYDDDYFSGMEYPDYLGQQNELRLSMRRHLAQMARFQALGGSLLEVGCAFGLFLDEARAHFSTVQGIDVCEGPVRHSREVLGLDALVYDFLAGGVPGSPVDTLCMWDTIEHVERPDAFIARGHEVLRPGGALFLTTGDISSFNARLRGRRWRQIHPPSHLNYFSRRSIARLLESSGFQILGIETASYYHSLFNILASVRLRGELGGAIAAAMLGAIGERRARGIGLWLNLGDTMFVAARRC